MSYEIVEVRLKTPAPGSKSIVPQKPPDVIMFPDLSILMDLAQDPEVSFPAICFAQIKFPFTSNFNMNAFIQPGRG